MAALLFQSSAEHPGNASAATVTTSTTLAPVADAHVNEQTKNKNFGSSLTLSVAGAPVMRSYLRFNVPGLTDPITRATLRMNVSSSSSAGYAVRSVASNSWAENSIKFTNAPPVGEIVASSGSVTSGWKDIDVTSLVRANAPISIGLTAAGSAELKLASREAVGKVPQLIIETQSEDSAPPTPSITTPLNGTTTGLTPIIGGEAGTAPGDSTTLMAFIYSGTSMSPENLVQTLSPTRSGGTWSVQAQALAPGIYTARVEQSDAAGNVGQSQGVTFTAEVPPPAPALSYRDAVTADLPRAYWRLGESSGTIVADEIASSHGTLYGSPSLGAGGAIGGDLNTSLAFDGINDTVGVTSAAPINPSGALSIEAFARPSSVSVDSTLIRKDGQYLVRVKAGGALSFRLWKRGAVREVATASGVVEPGAWSYVVASWDGAAMKIWVNGVKRAEMALAAPADVTTSRLYMGSSTGSYDWLGGRLDEVAIYGSALSAERIAAHYDVASSNDDKPPSLSLLSPAAASTMDAKPTFGGSAGKSPGDSDQVTIDIYTGSSAAGQPVETLQTTRRASGTFSVRATTNLPDGTYTARANQADAAGNSAQSQNTFQVDASTPATVLAAGDIAGCDTFGDEATAAVLDRLPGTVVPLGDMAYEDGSAEQLSNCYDPTWGRQLARTRPILGGHDYRTPGAAPYFDYFGAAAGDPSRGYYSYELGDWHVVALNAECAQVGGCWYGEPQEQWLRADLASHPSACTLALIHAPRFSSGSIHGDSIEMEPFWQALHDNGVELVLSGDDHTYERFAPQTPEGTLDPTGGIRQFVVGTGGRSHYSFGPIKANSEVRNNDTFGVLRLSLNAASYDWRFVGEAGSTFSDTGSDVCH